MDNRLDKLFNVLFLSIIIKMRMIKKIGYSIRNITREVNVMDTRELQKLTPIRKAVDSEEHFTLVCKIVIRRP